MKSRTIQEETITIETLIRAMRITGRWPGPGMYGWTRCYCATQTARALTLYMKNVHGIRNRNLRWQEQIEYVVGMVMRWQCKGEDAEQYKRIENCPYCNCPYVGMLSEALSSHMSQAHHDLLGLANSLGIVYATIIVHARNFHRIPPAEKLIRPTVGALCKRCKWFIGKDRLSVAQHVRKARATADIEGAPTETQRVEITPIWFKEDGERPTEDLRRADEGLQEDEERRLDMQTRRGIEANADMTGIQRQERATEAREKRLARERAWRESRRNEEVEPPQVEETE